MLKSIVGEPHPKGVLLLVNPVPDNLILLLDQLDQFPPSDDCIGDRTLASSDGLKLSGQIVGQSQRLSVDVAVFPVAESKLVEWYSLPLGSSSSSLLVSVGRMIWYTFTFGFFTSSLISPPCFSASSPSDSHSSSSSSSSSHSSSFSSYFPLDSVSSTNTFTFWYSIPGMGLSCSFNFSSKRRVKS
jgi:hypothetical protein